MRIFFLCGMVASLSFAPLSKADTCRALYDKGEVDEGIKQCQIESNEGAWANFALGNMYLKTDLIKAIRWYKKGALSNEPNSLYMLGYLAQNGMLGAQEGESSYDWYLSAYILGHDKAGKAYANYLREIFNRQAITWQERDVLIQLTEGVLSGNSVGFDTLAFFFEKGKYGLDRDYNHAKKLRSVKRIIEANSSTSL